MTGSNGYDVFQRFQLFQLLNSLTTSRGRISIGSSTNALSVSTHFVSIGVTLYLATAACSSILSYSPRSRRYFNSCLLTKSYLFPGLFQLLDPLIWIFFTNSPTFLSPHSDLLRCSCFLDQPSRSSSPIFQILQFCPISLFFAIFQCSEHWSRSSSQILELLQSR